MAIAFTSKHRMREAGISNIEPESLKKIQNRAKDVVPFWV